MMDDDSEQLYLVHHALHSVSPGSVSDTTPTQNCKCRSCLRLIYFHALRTFAQYLSLTWTPSGPFAFYNDSFYSHPTSRRQMDGFDIAFFSVLSMLPTQISWISLPQTSQLQLKRDPFGMSKRRISNFVCPPPLQHRRRERESLDVAKPMVYEQSSVATATKSVMSSCLKSPTIS
jgi:hypothetical protein